MDRITLDQTKIRVVTAEPLKPGAEFPRGLGWWQRYVPVWLDVSFDVDGNVVLEPSGRRADGVVREVTPAMRRRYLAAAKGWIDSHLFLDFTDAIVATP
jgi:hypothetical protein